MTRQEFTIIKTDASGRIAVQTAPEIGQLVVVRKRPLVVTEIAPSTPGLTHDGNGSSRLIKLSSVEDDGLGEELQVIWELEPGTAVHEKSTLPDPDSFAVIAQFSEVAPRTNAETFSVATTLNDRFH